MSGPELRCEHCNCPVELDALGDWRHFITKSGRCELWAYPRKEPD